MNYIELLIDRFKKEVILTQDSNGYVTIGASFLESLLLSSMNGQLESIKKNLPEMADDFEFTSDDDLESNPTKALNLGFNNALAQVQELLDQMKFNPSNEQQ